jgi:hypothetical protein
LSTAELQSSQLVASSWGTFSAAGVDFSRKYTSTFHGGGSDLNRVTDPTTGVFHAALFKGSRVEIVPPQPNETFATVLSLNDNDVALVQSHDAAGVTTFVLYSRGKANVLDFGPTITAPNFIRYNGVGRWINDKGIIAGTNAPTSLYLGATGFSFNPQSGKAALLNPFPGDPTETSAWGQGINNRGDVPQCTHHAAP